MTETTFYAEDYTNHLGQIVKPGDDVVMVSTGYAHSISIRKGTFLGVRKCSRGHFRGATCEYDQAYTHYKLGYGNPDRYKSENFEKRTRKTKTTLKLGRVYTLTTEAWNMSV